MSTQEKKKEKKYIRRSGAKIMASLVVLLGSLSYIMILEVINMNFVWNTNELNASVVSIYETNITLNTTACMHFENVNYVLLGIDYDNHCIGIKPVGKQAINDGIYPQDQLHKISRGKSYGRITNKPFIKELADLIPLDFNEKNVFKFKGTYDIVHEVLIVDYKEGKLNG